jgi:intracellular septation protein A
VLTIGCNVVAPIVTYQVLTDHGVGEFRALLLSGVWPVIDTVIHLAWKRKLDEFAIVSLAFVLLAAVVTLIGPHSSRLLLVKDSAVTGVFGLVCLLSLAAPRPLMFYFGRKFATDGTVEGAQWWNGMWRYEGFRRVQRVLTIGWGAAYTIEAVVRIVLSYELSTDTMVVVNSVLAYGVTAALATWTAVYSRRAQARNQAAARAASAA